MPRIASATERSSGLDIGHLSRRSEPEVAAEPGKEQGRDALRNGVVAIKRRANPVFPVPGQEPERRAEDSADPVALTEADPMSVDELILQEAGRDLRPDVVTEDPDMSLAVDTDAIEAAEEFAASEETNFDPSSEDVAATDETPEDEKQ